MLDRLFGRTSGKEPSTSPPSEQNANLTGVAKRHWQEATTLTVRVFELIDPNLDLNPETKAFVGPYLRLMYASQLIAKHKIDHNYPYHFRNRDLEAVEQKTKMIFDQRAQTHLADLPDAVESIRASSRLIAAKLAGLANFNRLNLILTLGTQHTELKDKIRQNWKGYHQF